MIDILMQLADIGSTVTIVVSKKEELYLISVTPKIPKQNLQPVLISGKKEDILKDFDNVLAGMKQMKASISNIQDINTKLEKTVTEKVAPTATAKTEKADKKKGPLKVGSGTTVTKGADLFGTTVSPEQVEDIKEAEGEELTDEEVNAEDEATDEEVHEELSVLSPIEELKAEQAAKAAPIVEPSKPIEEEEEIF